MASSRWDFTLEAACKQAQPEVLDQVFFSLHADKFKQFTSMLDASPSRTYAYLVRTGTLEHWHSLSLRAPLHLATTHILDDSGCWQGSHDEGLQL